MNSTPLEAVIFDLDGVITNSTPLHSLAWKTMFDQFLISQSEVSQTPYREFTHRKDYLTYLDGKPRYQGVQIFLESRGIDVPYGDPSQSPNLETICGLGNLKNEIFNQLFDELGVEVYPTTITLLHELRDAGILLGLASSSKNAAKVLESTGLFDLFQTRVDGVVSANLGLQGKPSPDIFQIACDNLGAAYENSVIIEDANAGVQAGYKGGFGLVVGVAREDNKQELELHGADITVEDLGEVNLKRINYWFREGNEKNQWSLEYSEFDPLQEKTREALCAIGNGFLGSRGAFEEMPTKSDLHYPGTYISGLYNRLESSIADRTITNEDLVNCPNWLPLTFKFQEGEWFNPDDVEILEFYRQLEYNTGLLYRRMLIKDQKGHQTLIQSWRVISMENPHLAAIQYQITPLNHSQLVTIRSELDGTVINQGVKRYQDLNSKHLDPVREEGTGSTSLLVVKTNQSQITIAEAAKLIVKSGQEILQPEYKINTTPGKVSTTFNIQTQENQPLIIEKIVSIHSSHLSGNADPILLAQDQIQSDVRFFQVLENSCQSWKTIWDKIDIKISGDRVAQRLIRLHLFQTMVSVSPHSAKYETGIPARGLHGEAYRGHIFWDELYVMPFFNFHFPEIARSALIYRYRRLPAAIQSAKMEGFKGAMFPWQSGSSGLEESQSVHLNPISGKWGPDYSHLQRHVSLAITYNLWHYIWTTEDLDFLYNYGGELYLEICRFWIDMAIYNPLTDRFSISSVMGPDEFHETNPNTDDRGLEDNGYTNLMVAWTLNRAFDLLKMIKPEQKTKLLKKLNLSPKILREWKNISNKLTILISEEGILEQFAGFFELEELDWDHYKKTYGNIHRMDRILKAEGLSPNMYKVLKQADALMLFYNLSEENIAFLLNEMGYQPTSNLLEKNFQYYLGRTSHGSTLSKLVHAHLAHQINDHDLCWKYYFEALRSDYNDTQVGTTQEGIHLGVMTGTTLFAIRTLAGLDWGKGKLVLNPHLPIWWKSLEFNLSFRNGHYFFNVQLNVIKIKFIGSSGESILVCGEEVQLTPGKWIDIKY